mgnify:CR=1 FL=1
MFITEGFWVTVAFFVLIFAIFKPVKGAIFKGLDAYANDIKATLKEAQDLKDEASESLKAAKKELEDSKRLADEVVERSEEESKAIIKNAKKEAELEASKQVDLILSNFETRKKQMIADIKEQAAAKAIEQVAAKITEDLEESELEAALIDASLDSFKHTKH